MIIIADGSHHKTVNMQSLQDANIGGLMWKATEGATFVDNAYQAVHDRAKLVNMPFVAMHYQHTGTPVASEVDNVKRVVSTDTALVIDIEKGSGDTARTRDLVAQLRQAGYHIPWLYLPRWYWDSIGQPNLSGLPGIWNSHYVNGGGDPRELFKNVPISWWESFGGNIVQLLQFTSSGQLPGQSLGDYSLFNGDSAQFRRFIDPNHFDYNQGKDTEPMIVPKGTNASFPIAVPPTKRCSLIIAPGDGSDVVVNHVYTWGDTNNQGTGYDAHADVQVREYEAFALPVGTGKVSLQYTSNADFAVTLDIN